MVHLSEETLSELLEGESVTGAKEHLASCPVCRGELEALRRLRSELRELPELDAPPELWSRIEARLPVGGRARGTRRGWRSQIAMQVAALAAVFVLGLGLGRMFAPGDQAGPGSQLVSERAAATSLADAMAEVRRLGAQYDAALRNLEQLAAQEGAPTPSLAEQRLASLDALVEASRTALSVEPADPVLNSYLFAALEERAAVLRQMRVQQGSGSEVLWR
ncbi:MAG: hypothetical protein JSV41_13890 [Gemmatimonadota bacterium]|nr:MAG: hypothetical protein JSV41_13890 [Gemmatimonadota bacterium]